MINAKDRLIVAIDTDEFDKAKELIDQLEDSVDIFKVGLEQYVATKGKTVDYLKEKGKKIFLDLKFHDIPNTMKSAVKAAEEKMLAWHEGRRKQNLSNCSDAKLKMNYKVFASAKMGAEVVFQKLFADIFIS